MGKNRLILKTTSYLLIGVMVYMHICSAWCAIVPERSCCSKTGTESSQKSCCSHHKDSNKQEKGCQDFHLAFFKAAGQFSSENNVEVGPVFIVMPTSIFDGINIGPADSYQNLVAFNMYHPPPPISDIRMFIQSFQI